MIKLAILAQGYLFDPTSVINGSLVQLHNLSKAFAQKGIQVHYISTTKDASKPKYEHNRDIHFHWIQASNSIIGWKKMMPYFRNQLEEIKPDAIYVRGRNVMQFVAGKYAKTHDIPFVWGTNGDDGAEYFKNTKSLFSKDKNVLKKIFLLPLLMYQDSYINKGMNAATFVVNQNKHQCEETKRILSKDGLVVSNYYQPYHTIQEKNNSIIWIGRWAREKQPLTYVSIVSKLEKNNWTFILAGSTQDVDYSKKIIYEAKKQEIRLPGQVPFEDVPHFMAKNKILLNTSLKEGMSNTFIEALMAGTPVLSLNSDPNNWLNENGIGFCAYGDEEKLQKKLQELIDNPELIDSMGIKARAFAEKQFSSDKIIDTYIELFKNEKC